MRKNSRRKMYHPPSWMMMGMISLALLCAVSIPPVYANSGESRAMILAILIPIGLVIYIGCYFVLVGKDLYKISEGLRTQEDSRANAISKELRRLQKAIQIVRGENDRMFVEFSRRRQEQQLGQVNTIRRPLLSMAVSPSPARNVAQPKEYHSMPDTPSGIEAREPIQQ